MQTLNNLRYVVLSRDRSTAEGSCDKWHIFGEASDTESAFHLAMRAKDKNGCYGIYRAVEMEVVEGDLHRPQPVSTPRQVADTLKALKLAKLIQAGED